jgi:molecular chaperone GrpE
MNKNSQKGSEMTNNAVQPAHQLDEQENERQEVPGAVSSLENEASEEDSEQTNQPGIEQASNRDEPVVPVVETEDAEIDAIDETSEAEIISQLQEELAAAHAQIDDYVDKLKRNAAEFQNSRRRQERQLAEAIDRANADLIRRLLPILDDFDLAFQNAPDFEDGAENDDEQPADHKWVTGFRQIQKKLLDLLQEQGVVKIDATGEFDPSRHEAVLSEPSDEVESGHIVDVLRAGYEYKGQLLRPAMVRVAA